MMTLVVYDISDDGVRRAVEKRCKDYGLRHIQRSAFAGILSKSQRLSLFYELSEIMKGREGAVRIYVMDRRLYGMTMRIGRVEGFDPDPEYGGPGYVVV